MLRLTQEIFQSRLSCTQELLDNLAKLSDETLRQVNKTSMPSEMLAQYRKLIETMHQLAADAAKLAESAAKLTPADGALLQ